MSRRLRIPREPLPLAYLLLAREKRRGHLPCGRGTAGRCADCTRVWEEVETDHYPGPPDPVMAAAVDLLLAWYADPQTAVPQFEPTLVP